MLYYKVKVTPCKHPGFLVPKVTVWLVFTPHHIMLGSEESHFYMVTFTLYMPHNSTYTCMLILCVHVKMSCELGLIDCMCVCVCMYMCVCVGGRLVLLSYLGCTHTHAEINEISTKKTFMLPSVRFSMSKCM